VSTEKPETKVEIMAKAALKAAQRTQKVREVTKILRTQFPELKGAEAKDGAVTAIAYVVSRASWIRMMQRGSIRKRIVLCPDACEICRRNDEQGPIPIDQAFKSGQQHPPFHGSCRCALVPSR
jgi:hypothetical protein